MADKAETAEIPACASGFGRDETGTGKVSAADISFFVLIIPQNSHFC
jgi:hypothetical protein